MQTETRRRLSPHEAESLWRSWVVRHDTVARDRLVLSYAPMVNYLAARKIRELPSHCELDDLASCGLVALIEAVDRFDPKKGASFEQYAWTRVTGAIIDELRRQDWASRSVRRFGRRLESTRERFFVKNGRAPDEQELATALQLTAPELRHQLEELERADLSSLNASARAVDDSETVEVGETVEASRPDLEPESATLSHERARVLRSAIASLSEREQVALRLVHLEELQGAEIGRRLGVSESRVSQILAGIRRKLHDDIAAYDAPRGQLAA
ncbi:MAG: sigma-70 family RNA polymerase sigma factor [Gaiellaceae bacterium]